MVIFIAEIVRDAFILTVRLISAFLSRFISGSCGFFAAPDAGSWRLRWFFEH
jgi:hypothetical protein